ncbi:MAG TPA: AMP-binding protein, partial [Pyrinomonadaceae bacterium]
LGVLVREVGALYEAYLGGAESPLKELSIQYADFAIWQRQWLQGEVLAEKFDYWKRQLSGAPSALELPTDHPRPPVQSVNGAKRTMILNRELSGKLKELSRSVNATLFMTLLAAWQTLLSRYSGQDDISVGTPIAGRNRRETEELIGFFVNTLVLRTDLAGDPSFIELLKRVREVALGAYAHQDVPFEKLVEELQPERDMSRSPLFQAFFVLQNAPMPPVELTGLKISPLRSDAAISHFDLTLDVVEQEGELLCTLEYATDLFEETTAARILDHFQRLLDSIAADPNRRLSALQLLMPTEERQLLVEWNETQADYPADLCLHELFEAQVERTPEAIALIFEDERLSYGELNRRANLVAHHLRGLGAGPEMLVGVLMERSLEMVIALLGVLKAGAAYLPLDPTYPAERLGFMLDDAEVKLLLTQQRLVKGLPAREGQEVVCLDVNGRVKATNRSNDEQNPIRTAMPENLAYVIYTSGSTGRPKGVMIPHRAVVSHNFAVATRYDLRADDRVLQFASLSFDVAVEEIFPSWSRGAAVVVRSDSALNSHRAIFELIEKECVSVVNLSTPYWNELMAELAQTQSRLTGSLRLAAIGGEKGLPEGFDFARQQIGDGVRLLNVYGPTETTVTNTAYEFTGDSSRLQAAGSVPIGSPI